MLILYHIYIFSKINARFRFYWKVYRLDYTQVKPKLYLWITSVNINVNTARNDVWTASGPTFCLIQLEIPVSTKPI